MRPLATLTTLLLTLPSLAYSAYCSGSPDPNAPSNSLPTTLNPAKTLVNSTDNGLVYKYNDDKFHSFLVTHLWGTPYEQGYAQGEMMGDEIDDFFQTTYEYLSKALAEEVRSCFNFVLTIHPRYFNLTRRFAPQQTAAARPHLRRQEVPRLHEPQDGRHRSL